MVRIISPLPWLKEKIERDGKARRTIEKDYKFYDTPDTVWDKIHGPVWKYSDKRRDHAFYETRDRAFMALQYLTVCRVSELCRANLKNAGYKPSITKDQFRFEDDEITLRGIMILKGYEKVEKGKWEAIQDISHYPLRQEIHLPLVGDVKKFTEIIVDYLDKINDRDELFKFRRSRAHQIVKHTTGEMNHYFRDMGLKMYARVLDRNLKDLQDFSGHARVETLMKYQAEGQLKKKLIEYKW